MLAVLALAGGCSGDDDGTAADTTTTVAPETTTTTEPPLEEGTQFEPLYYEPVVGECFDRRKVPGADGTKLVDTILRLDCQLLHQYETFATLEYPLPDDGDTTWPGDEAVRNHARGSCPAYFEDYVGTPYETSVLEIGLLLPPEKNFAANQTIGCYVYDPTQVVVVDGRQLQGRTAGTARGSGR